MLTIAGALLVAGGCVWAGFAAVHRLVMREKTLLGWVMFIERLEREIGFCLASMPELVAQLTHPCLVSFRAYVEREYTPFGQRDFGEVWREAAGRLDLSEQDRLLVGSIGEIVGRYDADSQTRGLAQLHERMTESLRAAGQAKARHARVYGMLGFVCGLVVIILFAF